MFRSIGEQEQESFIPVIQINITDVFDVIKAVQERIAVDPQKIGSFAGTAVLLEKEI